MPLSWNEIKTNAIAFSKDWADTIREEADAKPFLDAFFAIFGITRKKIATFEDKVKKLDHSNGYIDLLWKGTLLVEMKSRGKDLAKAYEQAKGYLHTIPQIDLPQYVLVCDFHTFHLYDYETDQQWQFNLPDLIKHIHLFGFIAGYTKQEYKEQDPVNIKAADLMGKLHDKLKENGYTGHALELYLVRLLFCLFAEDTTIFEKDLFRDYITERTAADGNDLASKIAELFYILDTPFEKRLKNIDEQLNKFPYVNGKLFTEQLPPAAFDKEMRDILLRCCNLNWGNISPAIFGSMFQSVMNPQERRNLGAHYTSEKNILKLIKPLFLDELTKEFETVKHNTNRLKEFHNKLGKLIFLDPACGCGNFLVITYRELRLLELEIMRVLYQNGERFLNIGDIVWLNVDMMYGIEYEEFPAQIAQVAMWLMDHQMNMRISQEFGSYFVRLPLRKSAEIVHGNALELDWKTLIAPNELSYILGNPPFIGKKEQNAGQKEDMQKVFAGIKGAGILDYVTAWYLKAAEYVQKTTIKAAFVSTNSITQGEQVGIIWNLLFNKYNIKIHFAHRTFKWSNEAKGNAAVHCVIIGFANFDINRKIIFEYENINGDPQEIIANNINPYLVATKDVFLENRKRPISKVPEMNYGSMPIDNGNLILSDEDKESYINEEQNIITTIRPYTGGDEFLNNKKRWCLWLVNTNPQIILNSRILKDRISKTKEFRLNSGREATQKLADTPTLFGEIRQPNSEYIIIPKVSSENRKYIPIGILNPNIITNGSALIVPKAEKFEFGILASIMHMTWTKNVCGRMKSDYQYSASIVYNNYPFPQNPTDKQKQVVEAAAQSVLEARAMFPDSSLADLYNPLTMPPALTKAHQTLDRAVDACYTKKAFANEASRMEFLFDLYEQYTAQLNFDKKPKRKKKAE